MMDQKTMRARREILQRDATKAAAAAGVDVAQSMIVPMLVARARIIQDENDAHVVDYLSIKGDWFLTGTDVIREMMAAPEFAPVFGKSEKRSPAAKPTESKELNPFRPGLGWNLTKQCWLLKNDPKLAARLQAAAGE